MKRIKLDPRTKILLLLTISVFILGGVGGSRMWLCNIVLCLVPLWLLILHKEWVTAISYIVLYGIGLITQQIMSVGAVGMFQFVLLICNVILTRLLPGIMTGRYVLSTTKVS